jgi:hypothetical protein
MFGFLELVHHREHPMLVFGDFVRMKMQTKVKKQNVCPMSHNGADVFFLIPIWFVLEEKLKGNIVIPLLISRCSYLDSSYGLYAH